MVASVRRDSRIASAAARRSPRTRVWSLASMATSVPVPTWDRMPHVVSSTSRGPNVRDGVDAGQRGCHGAVAPLSGISSRQEASARRPATAAGEGSAQGRPLQEHDRPDDGDLGHGHVLRREQDHLRPSPRHQRPGPAAHDAQRRAPRRAECPDLHGGAPSRITCGKYGSDETRPAYDSATGSPRLTPMRAKVGNRGATWVVAAGAPRAGQVDQGGAGGAGRRCPPGPTSRRCGRRGL